MSCSRDRIFGTAAAIVGAPAVSQPRMFAGWMFAWVLTADHASLLREPPLVIRALSFGAFLAGLYGAVYLALEP